MRKLILKMELSLDGYVEGPNGQMDWFGKDNGELWKEMFSYLDTVDTVVIGRGMFAGYADFWQSVLDDPKADPNNLAYARWAAKTPHIVFSKTLKETNRENYTINSGDLKEEVLKLKQQPGKNIITWGGASFATSCIDLGIVDEYRFTINPVILAGGKSIFHNLTRQQSLQLISSKALPSGSVITLVPKQAQ